MKRYTEEGTEMKTGNGTGDGDYLQRNQLQPDMMQVNNLKKALRSKEKFIYCPYCKKGGLTRVEMKISLKSVICCLGSAGIPWVVIQWVRGKDINCFDARHKCSKCDQLIADYTSC